MKYNSSEIHFMGADLTPSAEMQSRNFTISQVIDYSVISKLFNDSSMTSEDFEKIISAKLASSNADQQSYFLQTVIPNIEKIKEMEAQVSEKSAALQEVAKSLQSCIDSQTAMNQTYSMYQRNLEKTNEQYSYILIAMFGCFVVIVVFYIHQKKEGKIFG